METIRGIPEDQWLHPQLMDLARMTDKQRIAYWRAMGEAEIRLLNTKGNLCGEKPEHPIKIEDWVKGQERAHQRAMTYQYEVLNA
jgi:hypothetical protein